MSSKGVRHVYITKPNFTSMYRFQGTDKQILKGRFSQNTQIKRIPIWKQQESGKNWWKSKWKWSLGVNFHQLGSSCIRAIAMVLLLAADHRHVDNIIGFNNIGIIIIIIVTLIITAWLSLSSSLALILLQYN